MKRRLSVVLWLVSLISIVESNLLMPGIYTETLTVRPNMYELMGVPQSCLAGTEVAIRMECIDQVDLEFEVQFVLRSSPCDKEFFNSRKSEKEHFLPFYFEKEYNIPDSYDYSEIAFYKSVSQKFNCKNSHTIFTFPASNNSMVMHNVTPADPFATRTKRAGDKFPGTNEGTLDGGTTTRLSTWNPAQKVLIDGIYFLIIKVGAVSYPSGTSESAGHNITLTVEWRNSYGYLSAIDYPLLRFYILMCVFYAVLALTWLFLCIKYYREILRIQYWIGAVIILGMTEKAFFLSEYSTMNTTGKSIDGILELAEMVSCAKKTMSRVLVIIVSVGYGIVKPRLGNTFSQVAGVGLVYFVFCSIEGIARVSKNTVEAAKQKQFAALPLIITEMVIFYWIYTSLTATMRTLRLRRNEVKLRVYRNFTNTLLLAVIISVVFMIWSMFYHILPVCLMDWKELWVDTAFWHVQFCFILVVICILWRPSQNNRGYAFTPLLDDSEDENDQDEIFDLKHHSFEKLKARQFGEGAENRRQREFQREQDREDQKIREDLKWIEENIPSSLTDQLLGADEDEAEARELEVNKML